MNFARDLFEQVSPSQIALVEIDREGVRREFDFATVARHSAALAGTLEQIGVARGDVVAMVIGNRPQWVYAMLACFHIGAVALPCNEQLRAEDLRKRFELALPVVVAIDPRNSDQVAAANCNATVLDLLDDDAYSGQPAACAELEPEVPALIVFTSGSQGEPKGVVHAQRFLPEQQLQSKQWFAAKPGELAWCTASSGWSKSARNAFIAPWLCGATALLVDKRFAANERLEIIERERVAVLCMAPTEYRICAKRTTLKPIPSLRHAVAAGEALNPEVLLEWREQVGVEIRDGYGQTETSHLAATPLDEAVRPGSMGKLLPGIRGWLDDGELVLDPSTVPTFFSHYLGEVPGPRPEQWRTGDRMHEDEDGFLYFEGRTDDVINSAGYRIGPFEVESALVEHPAVAEAAAVAAPDSERGEVVKAVIVLRPEYQPSDELAQELQQHTRERTAPYKYPRVVEFVSELPKTSSGKVRRAALRDKQQKQ